MGLKLRKAYDSAKKNTNMDSDRLENHSMAEYENYQESESKIEGDRETERGRRYKRE